ncbi:MAG: hypothetical protein R3F49_16405 [Planctomycetota bacterium]
MDPVAIDRFGAAVAAAEEALAWRELEPLYCEGDARGFFDEDRIEHMRDTALAVSSDLAELYERQAKQERPARRTLFIGAAVAELWIVLFERIVLKRRYAWVNLPGVEARALDAALAAAEPHAGTDLPRLKTAAWNRAEIGPVDHLWLCSVLTDPERFPALHDELYGRIGSPEAIGGGHPKRERGFARDLVLRSFECLGTEGLVTTTDEELAVLRPLAREVDATLDAPQHGQTSALVGDVLRHCAWRRVRS